MTSPQIDTTSTATAQANVYVATFDLADIDDQIPRWSELPHRDRLRACRAAFDPIAESWSRNTTTIELDELRALNFDATRSVDDKPVAIAIGDGATAPAHGNRELNNELGQTSIDEYETEGGQITFNAYLPREDLTDDGAGSNPELVELGVVTEAGRLLNHSLFSSITKTAQRAVQFQITLSFDTATA